MHYARFVYLSAAYPEIANVCVDPCIFMSARQNTSFPNAPSLIHVKLRPPRQHSDVVRRDDLLARLDIGLTKKLTLVSAPTGYGKTTLVSMWVASRKMPSAWVTLDENDNDPARFWTYVISALRTFDSSLGKTALSALMAPQPPSFQTLLAPLINELAQLKEACVLVLEDYHTIKSKEINAGVSFLIQHLPETLHLVFITRTSPDLPLPILRVRDELLEIGVTDLRFNQAETEAFLRIVLRTELPSTALTRLLQKTEGWAAGLRLVALLLQNKDSAVDIEKLIQSFSGSDRYVADYLIQEVFDAQTQMTQTFLLMTCFFRRLTGSLCDAITGTDDSSAMLRQLEHDHLFIAQLQDSGDQVWYRYNPLFAESIRYLAKQQLTRTDIESLFEKASGWYEYHGVYDEAIETALSAKLYDRALILIEKFIEIHDLNEAQTIGRWLENIPRLNILLYPVVCFTYAQVILYTTDRFAPATAVHIEPFLSAAESAWRSEENHERLGQLLSFRGNVAWWQSDFQKAFEYVHQSLAELSEHDVFWRGNSLLSLGYEALSAGRVLEAQDVILEARALLGAVRNVYGVLAATQMLGEVFYWQGEFEQAERLNQQILVEAVGDESMLDDQGIASLNLAHIAYERNDLEMAEQYAGRAFDLGQQRANEMLQMQAVIRLAHIHFARDDVSHAYEVLKSLEAKIQNPALVREIQNAQALFSIRSNDISSLEWWVNIISAENVLHMQQEREAFTLARLKIAAGQASESLNLLDGWKVDAARNGRLRSQVEALCLDALAYYADSNLPEAWHSLAKALTIGQAKGFRRLFLDEGRRMASLLQVALPTFSKRSLSLFAASLLHSFTPQVTSSVTAADSMLQIEALSHQELRVLRLLVAGLSNVDIARELVVSTNTIKTQVKSIYRKLSIQSREEARQVARELKLL